MLVERSNGFEFVKNQMDMKYAELIAYRKYPEVVANSYVANLLEDLQYFILSGLVVRPIFMNPEGDYTFIDLYDNSDDFLQYYALTSKVNISMGYIKIPEMEMSFDGIPQIYEEECVAMETIKMYTEYFSGVNQITTYRI